MSENESPNPGSYAWDEEDEDRSFGERLGVGLHFCATKKVVFGSNANGPFQSNDGDAQVMLVFGDEEREATLMLTCSEKAGWVIRKTCSALGNDMEEMKAAGVHPNDFALEDVAVRFLTGKFGWFNGHQKGAYVNFDPIKTPKAVKLKADAILKSDNFDEESQKAIAGGADSKEVALEQAQRWADTRMAAVRAEYAESEAEAPEAAAPGDQESGEAEANPFDDN